MGKVRVKAFNATFSYISVT